MSKSILTQARVRELFNYDSNTGNLIRITYKSPNANIGDIAGNSDSGYSRISVDSIRYFAHQIIWLYVYGMLPVYPEHEVDHLDQDTSNNRIDNLRLTDSSGNMKNKPKYKNNKSGSVGVRRRSDNGKWQAYIGVDGKLISLGTFNCITAAVIARKAAEVRYGFHANHGK